MQAKTDVYLRLKQATQERGVAHCWADNRVGSTCLDRTRLRVSNRKAIQRTNTSIIDHTGRRAFRGCHRASPAAERQVMPGYLSWLCFRSNLAGRIERTQLRGVGASKTCVDPRTGLRRLPSPFWTPNTTIFLDLPRVHPQLFLTNASIS